MLAFESFVSSARIMKNGKVFEGKEGGESAVIQRGRKENRVTDRERERDGGEETSGKQNVKMGKKELNGAAACGK